MSSNDQEQSTVADFMMVAGALSRVFAEVEGVSKDASNPAFRSKYADISSVLGVLRPALAKHGLFVVQNPTLEIRESDFDTEGNAKTSRYLLCLTTVVFHSSGARMEFPTFRLPVSKPDAQGVGSAITYARRYVLMSLFCLSTEDDDGNSASGREVEASKEIPARVVRR